MQPENAQDGISRQLVSSSIIRVACLLHRDVPFQCQLIYAITNYCLQFLSRPQNSVSSEMYFNLQNVFQLS